MNFFGNRYVHTWNREPNVSEKKPKVSSREDVLLKQIDEFREKAKQLQVLLEEKEQRVSDLEQLVTEREQEAKGLEKVLQSKRDEADQLIVGVTIQIQEMIAALDKQMEQFNIKTERQVEQITQASGQQMEDLKFSIQALNGNLEGMKQEITEKVHMEDVKCYRNVKGLFLDLANELEEMELGNTSLEKIQKSFRVWKFFSFFSFAGFLLLVLYILYTMGIFQNIL